MTSIYHLPNTDQSDQVWMGGLILGWPAPGQLIEWWLLFVGTTHSWKQKHQSFSLARMVSRSVLLAGTLVSPLPIQHPYTDNLWALRKDEQDSVKIAVWCWLKINVPLFVLWFAATDMHSTTRMKGIVGLTWSGNVEFAWSGIVELAWSSWYFINVFVAARDIHAWALELLEGSWEWGLSRRLSRAGRSAASQL